MMKIREFVLLAITGLFFVTTAFGETNVKMEKVNYGGWPNCIKLTNGKVELVVTTDIGPRVIRFGFVGGANLFKEWKNEVGRTGDKEWHNYGGHRLWHAPEAMPRTYALDNSLVKYEWDGKTLTLNQATEPETGIAKKFEITLDSESNKVTLNHYLINKNCWDVELSPWCLTVMDEGGRAIFPQEPYKSHPEYLLPARPLVLWHYTNLGDARWTFGPKYFQLQQDTKATTKQKVGFLNKQCWAAYCLKGNVFIKRFDCIEGATYPDYGCNTETYTQHDMLEVETLGPLTKIAPDGQVKHVERWYLFEGEVGKDEAQIDKQLLPLVEKTK